MVLGGEPLDVLEQWVKALFLAVPSGRGPRPVFDHLGRPYTVQHPYLLSDNDAAPKWSALSPQAGRRLRTQMQAHVLICQLDHADAPSVCCMSEL